MDCPECFGKADRHGATPECSECEYLESCRVCCDIPDRKINRRSGHTSYERYSYSEEVAASETIPDDSPKPAARPRYTDDDLRQLLEVLLRIDDYSLEILFEVMDGDIRSASDAAREFMVSRQAIHRKLMDSCIAHPVLKSIIKGYLQRCKKILKDHKKRRLEPQAEQQMELF